MGRGGSRQGVDAFVAGLKRSWKSFDEGWIVERKVNISLMKDNDEVNHINRKIKTTTTHLFRVPRIPDRVTM